MYYDRIVRSLKLENKPVIPRDVCVEVLKKCFADVDISIDATTNSNTITYSIGDDTVINTLTGPFRSDTENIIKSVVSVYMDKKLLNDIRMVNLASIHFEGPVLIAEYRLKTGRTFDATIEAGTFYGKQRYTVAQLCGRGYHRMTYRADIHKVTKALNEFGDDMFFSLFIGGIPEYDTGLKHYHWEKHISFWKYDSLSKMYKELIKRADCAKLYDMGLCITIARGEQPLYSAVARIDGQTTIATGNLDFVLTKIEQRFWD